MTKYSDTLIIIILSYRLMSRHQFHKYFYIKTIKSLIKPLIPSPLDPSKLYKIDIDGRNFKHGIISVRRYLLFIPNNTPTSQKSMDLSPKIGRLICGFSPSTFIKNLF